MCRSEIKDVLVELGIFVLFTIPALFLLWLINYIDSVPEKSETDLSQMESTFHDYGIDKEKTNYEVFHSGVTLE